MKDRKLTESTAFPTTWNRYAARGTAVTSVAAEDEKKAFEGQ